MPKKIDATHKLIVDGLRAVGAEVQSLADLGRGVPDILCGFRGRWYGTNVTLFLKTSQNTKEYRNSAVRGQDFLRISSGPTNTEQFNKSLSKRFSADKSTEYTEATSDTQNGSNRTLKLLVYALTIAVILLLLFQERMDNELSNAFKRIAELEQRNNRKFEVEK